MAQWRDLLFADGARLVRGLGGHRAGITRVLRLLLQQSFQLRTRLIDYRRGKPARRVLPLLRQIFDAHIEQGDILFKPAQRSLHFGNAKIVGHDSISP